MTWMTLSCASPLFYAAVIGSSTSASLRASLSADDLTREFNEEARRGLAELAAPTGATRLIGEAMSLARREEVCAAHTSLRRQLREAELERSRGEVLQPMLVRLEMELSHLALLFYTPVHPWWGTVHMLTHTLTRGYRLAPA